MILEQAVPDEVICAFHFLTPKKTQYLDEEQENALLRTRLAYSKYVTGEQKGVAAVIRQIVRF